MININNELQDFMQDLIARTPNQTEFHQAVQEVVVDVMPYVHREPVYRDANILTRLTEPDRIISFRVDWQDDAGSVQVNRGYRVQHNNAIGPYKGGTRFHPNVSLSIFKFLAFEQTIKNSLTGLPLGAAKGGADFNPRGRSQGEIMRFCQAYMQALMRYIGPHTDVPAGDVGVGTREIGYMFGQQLRTTNQYVGTLTGKLPAAGGSLGRDIATGYGVVYILKEMLQTVRREIAGHTAIISGSGNVALFAAQLLIKMGVKVLTLSDSGGFIHDPDGLDSDKLAWLKDLKFNKRGRIIEYAKEYGVTYHAGRRPWEVSGDLVLPCATENELSMQDAQGLIDKGCVAVAEGANMPCTAEAIECFKTAGILFMPAKAANAGGVAISGLEMAQNSQHLSWTYDEVEEKLRCIMSDIYQRCVEWGSGKDGIDYVKGANVAGFLKVAQAMLAQGV